MLLEHKPLVGELLSLLCDHDTTYYHCCIIKNVSKIDKIISMHLRKKKKIQMTTIRHEKDIVSYLH